MQNKVHERRGRVTPHLIRMVAAMCLITLSPLANFAQAKPDLTDQTISDTIEDELVFDQAVPSYQVDISTQDGIVTLRGSVSDLLAKERAAKIASAVKGVRGVVNQLRVEPLAVKSDSALKRDVNDALLQDPATEAFEVTVNVNDGRVTLSGNVDSWQEKQLAGTVAKGVSGVTKLQNNIDVDYKTTRPDTEIRAEIKRRLRWSVFVDDALIDVAVKDGKVQLEGVAGSMSEKNRATAIAWVAGVKGVDAEELEVAKWARDPKMRKDKYVFKKDEAIQKAVNDALLIDPRVNAFNVMPDVSNGTVTLRGSVDNLKAKRAAEADVRRVVGVRRVTNRLKVDPETTISDSEIETNISRAFLRDPNVDSYQVNAEVNAGIVTLRGTVDTYFEKQEADDAASRVIGVILVNNQLDVEEADDPLVYDPYVDDFSPYVFDWYDYDPPFTPISDAEIKQEIQDEFFWSPFVDSADVKVTVDDGEATLTGTVDSWSERAAATENAYEGGATRVDNDLLVDYIDEQEASE